jgi:hypothetical protein
MEGDWRRGVLLMPREDARGAFQTGIPGWPAPHMIDQRYASATGLRLFACFRIAGKDAAGTREFRNIRVSVKITC